MWRRLRLLLLLSAGLFCFCSVFLQAEPADISKTELTQIFQTLDDLQLKNEISAKSLTDLMTKYQLSLTQHERSLMSLQQQVKLMEIESQVRAEALAKYEKETVWNDIGLFLAGSVLGYGLNELKNDLIP